MKKDERFTFVVDGEERKLIAALAERLQRTQSEAMRLLVRGAARELGVLQADGQGAGKPGERTHAKH